LEEASACSTVSIPSIEDEEKLRLVEGEGNFPE
jgi:hypothetical protein